MENIFANNFEINEFEMNRLNGHRSFTIWLTGLSGAGKTTLAKRLQKLLHSKKYKTKILDGDNLRTGLNKGLGFSEEDRKENIRRTAEVSKLFNEAGVITIASLITPTNELRDLAKDIIGKDKTYMIWVDAPLSICEERDPKGLYAKARNGEIKNFTGIGAGFEEPISYDEKIDTTQMNPDDLALMIYHNIKHRI